jgi:hypothetical protein
VIALALYIDGQLIPGSADDTTDPTGLYAADTLTITWGRDDTTSQPDPSTCSFQLIRPQPVSWLRVGRTVVVAATLGATLVPVFIGSITSLTLSWDGEPVVDVIADDILADLGNRRVASKPWPKESVSDRIQHVMETTRSDVLATVAPSIANVLVAKQDIDVKMATEVLQQVTASVDSVLWASALQLGTPPSRGSWTSLLLFEDPANRPALRKLAMPVATIVIVLDDAAIAASALQLDGCTFDLDPAEFVQDLDDVVTGVSVSYLTPDPTDSTAPDLAVTVDVIDPGAESPSGVWGVRRITLDSLLTNATDATATGTKILSRLRPVGAWRAPVLEFDQIATPAITDAQVLQLLDLRTRNGLPVMVPLPDWAPNAPDPLIGFLEGATLNYVIGSWSASLTISSALSYGAADVMWNDMPDLASWSWDAWDPAITWDDLTGVGPPTGV